MQLLNPCLARVLDRRIQEDDLVLYPDFMDNGFQRQATIRVLKVVRLDIVTVHECRESGN